MASDGLVVGFNPMPAAERVANYHAMIRSRLIWLGVALAICVGIAVWQRAYLTPLTTLLLFVIGLSGSVAWLGFALVMRLLCRRSLRAVGEGMALRIGPDGIEVGGRTLAWADVERINTVPGPICVGAKLAIHSRCESPYLFPLTHLDALPGTLDGAIRLYSGGTRSLDLSRLDN